MSTVSQPGQSVCMNILTNLQIDVHVCLVNRALIRHSNLGLIFLFISIINEMFSPFVKSYHFQTSRKNAFV